MSVDQSFKSGIRYSPERIHAAAIYCSDGRFGAHCDDFLSNGLHLPRYDRVALPGGPACLAGYPEAHLEEQGVVSELKFLVDAHELKRVVLIAHQGCAFYTVRLGLSEPALTEQQHHDLQRAADYIREITGLTGIESYFARLIDGKRIAFEPVKTPVTAAAVPRRGDTA